MKKSYFIIILAFLAIINVYSQFVSIPDTNFRKELKLLYPNCFNSNNELNTTCSSVTSALSLNVCSKNISDLTGLQYFTNLTNLCAKSNKLTSLPTLPSKLISLVCSDNSLTTLPVLPSTLTTLSCKSNKLSVIPALPTGLIYLDCSNNLLTVLPQLTANLNTVIADNNCFKTTPVNPKPSLLTTFKVVPLNTNCPTAIFDFLVNDSQVLYVYPNPAKDKITVTADGVEKLKIFSLDGILQHSEQISQTQDVFIRFLKPGVYYIKLGQKSSKLIIE